MINKELLDELKEIFRSDYGITFSDIEIAELGNWLLSFYSILSNASE